MLNIKPISAFNDNYIWCLYDTETKEALLVDPGDANAALRFLNAEKLKLSHILITHHHPDHIGGVNKLKQHFACKTVGFSQANYQGVDIALSEGSTIALLSITFKIIEVPGHATIPTTLGNECRINPFLGSERHEIATAAQAFTGTLETDPLSVFAAIREAKDNF